MYVASIAVGSAFVVLGIAAIAYDRAGLLRILADGQLSKHELAAAIGLAATGFGLGLAVVSAVMH